MSRSDLWDDVGRNRPRKQSELDLAEGKLGCRFADGDVGRGHKASPSSKRRSMNPGDHHRRAPGDALEESSQRKGVFEILVFGVIRRAAHPFEIASRRKHLALALQYHDARASGHKSERLSQKGDQLVVEGVANLRPGER